MRSFLVFCAYVAVALLLGACLTYPLQLLLPQIEPHQLLQRSAMLLAFLGLPLLLARLGMLGWALLGYRQRPPGFLRALAGGALAGALIILPLLAMQVMLGVRHWDLGPGTDYPALAVAFLAACLAGLFVAFIEETFFRGAMQSAIRREAGLGWAILLSSLTYALLHFVHTHYAPAQADWTLGFRVLGHMLHPFLMPAGIADSALALLAVGAVLGLVRARYDSLAPAIGMHMAWVVCIKLTRKVSDSDPTSPFAFLIGDYDQVIGWLAAFWLGALYALLWWRWRSALRHPRPSSPG